MPFRGDEEADSFGALRGVTKGGFHRETLGDDDLEDLRRDRGFPERMRWVFYVIPLEHVTCCWE